MTMGDPGLLKAVINNVNQTSIVVMIRPQGAVILYSTRPDYSRTSMWEHQNMSKKPFTYTKPALEFFLEYH